MGSLFMWYLYLDESGDLGFDFVNKRPSKFFTVAILVVKGDESNRALHKAIKVTLLRKFRKENNAQELKGSKCPLQIKQYFYRKVEKINFEIYAITLDKRRAYSKLEKDKERVYNFISRLVLNQIPLDNSNFTINIIVDKSKTKRNIVEFDHYILTQIKSTFDPKIPLKIYHYDSLNNLGLQAIDLFCWGIFRKYEQNDRKWFNSYKNKTIYDELYK